jgi:multidrug efflux system outer membrane protein
MKNKLYIFLALLSLFISSCGITKDLLVPKDGIPVNFRGLDPDSNSIGKLPIKDFFNTPAIRTLIDSALLRNNELLIALKNIDAAELLLKQARLNTIPQLTLGITASSNRPSDHSLNGISSSQLLNTTHIEDYNANLALSWEADIWGKMKRQKDAAYASFLQSTEVKKAVQTRIVAQVASSFYTLIMLDAQLEVANRNMELNSNTLKMIKLRYDAGQTSSLAVQQAESQLLVATQLLPQLNQAIVIQENVLSTLIGKFPSKLERQTILGELNVPNKLAVGVPSDLLQLRPDVKSAELDLRIANAKVGIANAQLYPSLVISASGGLNSFQASNWFTVPASLFGLVGAGITQPIFKGKALKTQFELAKIQRDQSVIRFRQTLLEAVAEVSNEQAKMNNLKNEYDIVQDRVKVLQLAVKNADLLFKSGMANYLEVIAAQSNLLRGELDLTSIKTAQLNASVSLYRSLGGGWQ